MRLLVRLLIASSLAGCALPPPIKPQVVLCIPDVPRREAICQSTGGSSAQYRIGMDTLDKNICFGPQDWEYLQGYIQYLEALVAGQSVTPVESLPE